MNKCTLLIDGNWLLLSRFSVINKGFDINNPDFEKKQAAERLKELLAKSINIILNRFKEIDNIIFISDGGSWRKSLPIPDSLKHTTYKGNRTQDVEMDWTLIYKTYNELFDYCKSLGITCSCHSNIEGDDWIWFWSKKLNTEGINCIIWSSDNDLKQLVQLNNSNNSFTAWYNDKNGLWLPEVMNDNKNDIDFFMNLTPTSPICESLKIRAAKGVYYIDPNEIILTKILCGDSGDNIKSIVRFKKNNRTYRFSNKDYDKLKMDLNIKTINDLLSNKHNVAKYISLMKKFKPYNFKISDIEEMLNYNINLVWLHDSIIPETVKISMVQQEYKQYDIGYIRSNYLSLIGENDDMKNLFESI